MCCRTNNGTVDTFLASDSSLVASHAASTTPISLATLKSSSCRLGFLFLPCREARFSLDQLHWHTGRPWWFGDCSDVHLDSQPLNIPYHEPSLGGCRLALPVPSRGRDGPTAEASCHTGTVLCSDLQQQQERDPFLTLQLFTPPFPHTHPWLPNRSSFYHQSR